MPKNHYTPSVWQGNSNRILEVPILIWFAVTVDLRGIALRNAEEDNEDTDDEDTDPVIKVRLFTCDCLMCTKIIN